MRSCRKVLFRRGAEKSKSITCYNSYRKRFRSIFCPTLHIFYYKGSSYLERREGWDVFIDKWDELTRIFSKDIRNILRQVSADFEHMQEIRMRVHGPLLMIHNNQEFFITPEGKLSRNMRDAFQVGRKDLKETLEYISDYSLYAFEEEIRQGFITIQGGHRIGLAGKTVMDRDGIRSMKYISFLNVRLSHQICGCGNPVLPYLYKNGEILHTLIISPPRCGKTTLLRDIIRQISNGTGLAPGMTVGVVDERSEIGACYQGIPQNDLGIRTDILDCCPKALGMMMLIRTMSPQVIAVDEIGSREDLDAIEYVINCGCRLIATVHGSSVEDVRSKPVLGRLLQEQIFGRYVVLKGGGRPGNVEQIYDLQGKGLMHPDGRKEL